jgi:SAM-dependent methyltransferase
MSWTAGYNNSVAYTTGYYHEQSPTYLNACLAMQRVSPPSIEQFTYCELGFGQGLTSLILAATYPQGDFYACDFNPLHVLAAASIRDEAQLPNLTLLENSFGELAQGAVELPMFDYITMHGIISWISDETRAEIVQFLKRYLKPGGVVQVSYNAMPGLAQVLPLQRLLMRGAARGGDTWTSAVALARQMVDLDALHFNRNPDSLARIQGFPNQNARYLVHEYLHENWMPFYFADLAGELADAKLSFAGSAHFPHMAPVGWLTGEQRQLLDTVTDPIEAEERQDYFSNRSFRSDIFVRGKVALSDIRLREHAEHIHLWGNPSVSFKQVVELEHATVTRGDVYHQPLFDRLRRSEMTLAELFDAPELAGMDIDGVLNLVRFSIAVEETSIRYGAARPRASADRLNAVLLSRAEQGETWNALASPRLGGGAGVGTLDLLMMASLHEKADRKNALSNDTEELTTRVARSLALTGLHLRVSDVEVQPGDITKRMGDIFEYSGNTLIAHSVERGFWTAQKTASE